MSILTNGEGVESRDDIERKAEEDEEQEVKVYFCDFLAIVVWVMVDEEGRRRTLDDEEEQARLRTRGLRNDGPLDYSILIERQPPALGTTLMFKNSFSKVAKSFE
jgi:hypothetical protein